MAQGRIMPTSILRYFVLIILLVSQGLLIDEPAAAERSRPILIGALTESWGPTPHEMGLRDGLRELGYREPEQFVIGSRFTQGNRDALPIAARGLVQYGVDLLFVDSIDSAQAAQMATTQIPIVFAGQVGNPVDVGLVTSFAHPGGNMTGVTDLHRELGPKRLEVFLQLVPGLKQVLLPYEATDTHTIAEVQVSREAAHRLGIELVAQAVRTEAEAKAFLTRVQPRTGVGFLAPRCCALNLPGVILESASQLAIPTMFRQGFWVERGGLASYGPDYYASGRQAARLVDKILQGAKPADIPVEVSTQIELVINLPTAQALGLTIAPAVLYQADRLVR
jgi:putative ABC transport system substrate-binding protein